MYNRHYVFVTNRLSLRGRKTNVDCEYMILQDILSFIFPEHCIGCNKQGNTLCAICERTITTKARALSGTTAALLDYHHPLVKKAIWALKYEQKSSLGRYFGNALYREFFKRLTKGNKLANEEIILLPIPAGKKAVAMRGYNHAEIIANTIAKCGKADGMNILVGNDILYKKKENTQQVKMREKAKREENVRGNFGIHSKELLRGKTIILIDDVITTGATMNEAKRVVRGCEPKRILAIAVAH